MKLQIAVLSGDGIGPEVTQQALKVIEVIAKKYGHQIDCQKAPIGAVAIEQTGVPLPKETLDICLQSDAILFGAVGDPAFDNLTAKIHPEQGLLDLRQKLGLYANIRPLSTYDSLLHKSNLKEEVIKDTNFVIYRELTGGIYFGKKEMQKDGKKAFDECQYSVEEIDRIAHLAFKSAMARHKKLTLVDKANVLETSRLWRKRVTELSAEYPEVELNCLLVDNVAVQMILNPRQFDVILTENMFGDMLSAEASIISGSIGLLASASIGEKTALFEPIHGSYPQAKGKNIANPLASILSVAMLLDHFELYHEAEDVRNAVIKSIDMNITTVDLNPKNPFSTTSVGNFISDYILEEGSAFFNQHNMNLGQSTII
ncbi:MAG: 3-isopropylmalate dehydrogenase [Flavobacteriaceae bacterium]|nr:3-isopropylmalate dehydrogenase [Flavobacteriaceae bacterium]